MRTGLGVHPSDRESDALAPYLPRTLLRHFGTDSSGRSSCIDASVLLVDVSGFTRLSERLARRGREGAEQLADLIGTCFASLLLVAYANGGSLVKFGGDAMLLVFEDENHAGRACRSALAMQRALRDAGTLAAGALRVPLRMSAGVHSGDFHLFSVGESHRELLLAGPGATEVVRMEKLAGAGQVVVSPATAAALSGRCARPLRPDAWLLRHEPDCDDLAPDEPPLELVPEVAERFLSEAVRAHLRSGPQPPEHRMVTVAFAQFRGTDRLVADQGPEAAATVLHDLVCAIQAAVEEQRICFLGSDIDADGGKFLLTSGAPRVLEDDEERMLLVARRVVEHPTPLSVRVGVNRGPVFAGDIGPPYRRTYSVMGDPVNLAARVMSNAPKGRVYVTPAVVERSRTRFAAQPVEPFAVKGKREPVHALELGPVLGRAPAPAAALLRVPLAGRDAALADLQSALEAAAAGSGSLVEIVGETGIGKTRLVEELRALAPRHRRLAAICDAYTAAIPYATWRRLLRQLLDVPDAAADDEVLERLRPVVAERAPELLPWLPLLAISFGADAAATPEVAALADEFRPAKIRDVTLSLLERFQDEHVLVEIEDAQLMDVASADVLSALADRLRHARWLVVVTRREPAAGGFRAPRGRSQRIDLEPLEPRALRALAQSLTEETPLRPDLLAQVLVRSAGNPQFLRDLIRAASAGEGALPDSIEAAAMARLDALRPDDRALVRRAAVLGGTFSEDLLWEVTGLEPDERVWKRLEAYFDRGADGLVRFRRPVVRETAYAALPFAVRRDLHASAGTHVERRVGEAAGDEAAVLSLHFLIGGDARRAWRYACAAGERASAHAAPAEAVVMYQRAIEAAAGAGVAPSQLGAVWEALAGSLERTGDPDGAIRALSAARRLEAGDPLRVAALLHRQALVTMDAGGVRNAVRWANRGIREIEGLDGPEATACRAMLAATLATLRQRQGRMRDAIALCRRAIVESAAAGEEQALARASWVLDWALVESGRGDEAGHSARALKIYRRCEDALRESIVLNNLGGFAYREGRWRDAVGLWQDAAAASAAAGDVTGAAFAAGNVLEMRSDQGRLREADEGLREVLRTFRATENEWAIAYTEALLGRVAVRDGRDEDAGALLEAAAERFADLQAENDLAFVGALQAERDLAAGRLAEALSGADRLLADRSCGERLRSLLHRVRGVALAGLGSQHAAEAALQLSLRQARAQAEDVEVAFTLDALELVAERPSPERSRELAAILARLDIERLPSCRPAQ